jgi:hypothetical protein
MLGTSATEATRPDGGRPLVEPSAGLVLADAQRPWRLSTPPLRSEYNPGIAKLESSVPGRVEVLTTSSSAGLLVLHDLDYPGWVADIDGKSTPIIRADILFRAADVPAGKHHVTFRFAPFSIGNLRAALNALIGWPSNP